MRPNVQQMNFCTCKFLISFHFQYRTQLKKNPQPLMPLSRPLRTRLWSKSPLLQPWRRRSALQDASPAGNQRSSHGSLLRPRQGDRHKSRPSSQRTVPQSSNRSLLASAAGTAPNREVNSLHYSWLNYLNKSISNNTSLFFVMKTFFMLDWKLGIMWGLK